MHPAHWHIPQFGKGGCMRLWSTLFKIIAQQNFGIGLAPIRVGYEILSLVVGEAVGTEEWGVENGG